MRPKVKQLILNSTTKCEKICKFFNSEVSDKTCNGHSLSEILNRNLASSLNFSILLSDFALIDGICEFYLLICCYFG